MTAEIIDLVRVLREGVAARSTKPMLAKRFAHPEPHSGELHVEYKVVEAQEALKGFDGQIAINSLFVPFAAAFCVIGAGEKPEMSEPDLELLKDRLEEAHKSCESLATFLSLALQICKIG